jgi:hypothetical protein
MDVFVAVLSVRITKEPIVQEHFAPTHKARLKLHSLTPLGPIGLKRLRIARHLVAPTERRHAVPAIRARVHHHVARRAQQAETTDPSRPAQTSQKTGRQRDLCVVGILIFSLFFLLRVSPLRSLALPFFGITAGGSEGGWRYRGVSTWLLMVLKAAAASDTLNQ